MTQINASFNNSISSNYIAYYNKKNSVRKSLYMFYGPQDKHEEQKYNTILIIVKMVRLNTQLTIFGNRDFI